MNLSSTRFAYLTVLASAFLLAASSHVDAATIIWDFDVTGDDGASTDGWTEVIGFSAPSAPATGGRSAAIISGGVAAQDNAHPTLLFRSPTFKLDGTGPLTFDLSGGQGDGTAQAILPTNDATVLAILNSTNPGVQGVALRDYNTGAYVLTKQRAAQGNSFSGESWTVGELTPFANDGKLYTFDYYEYKDGGWGHVEIDDVIVPGFLAFPIPEPATFLLAALALVSVLVLNFGGRRRQRAA